MSNSEHMAGNQRLWDQQTPAHFTSAFYDVPGFRAGRCTIDPLDVEELGDVTGRTLLHLQCHFGLDTLSWARRGATVTGVDFSPAAITRARQLADELAIAARFVCCNVYDTPAHVADTFDIVYTSGGVLCWLPDLPHWAAVIADRLRPGGILYLRDFHPIVATLDDSATATEPRFKYRYFDNGEALRFETNGVSYAAVDSAITEPSHEWPHSLGDIVTAVAAAGLRIDYLHEFPFIAYQALPCLVEYEPDRWHDPAAPQSIPLTFSLRATKVGSSPAV